MQQRCYFLFLKKNFGNKGCFLDNSGIAFFSLFLADSVSFTYDRHFAQRLLIHFAFPSFQDHHSVESENIVIQKMLIGEKPTASEV
ncbi:MAG: hypothetical protein CMJ79_12575 [Planctomycetaceae bacterium]|nr:hypothetical protein [Planctomycetaceae bacterium]